MSNVVAALTPSSWVMWVEAKSLHHLHCTWKYIYITMHCIASFALHLGVYLYYYEAVGVSIIMLFKPDV
jgi:hypothetical protein